MESSSRVVQLGPARVSYPSAELGIMEDCNELLHDTQALRQEMRDKGYLFVRGLHERQQVLTARSAVLNYIDKCGEKLSKKHRVEEGVLREGCGVGCIPFMEGHNDISHNEAVLAVIEGQRAINFFKQYFGTEVVTFDYKWLRAMPTAGFTGVHVDRVYMSRGSQDLLTMWTPLGDVDIQMGVLAVCEGSHSLSGFDHFHNTYGNMDAEQVGLKGTGWFTEDPFEITRKFGGCWKTADFRAGDAVIFNLRTVHMSTTNTTHFARLSCDTRWQPASHSMDPRFIETPQRTSTAKFGLLGKEENIKDSPWDDTTQFTTIDKLRQEWGI